MTACFYDDSNIIKVTMSEVSIFDLTNQKNVNYVVQQGYAIVLSPSKNYRLYVEMIIIKIVCMTA